MTSQRTAMSQLICNQSIGQSNPSPGRSAASAASAASAGCVTRVTVGNFLCCVTDQFQRCHCHVLQIRASENKYSSSRNGNVAKDRIPPSSWHRRLSPDDYRFIMIERVELFQNGKQIKTPKHQPPFIKVDSIQNLNKKKRNIKRKYSSINHFFFFINNNKLAVVIQIRVG